MSRALVVCLAACGSTPAPHPAPPRSLPSVAVAGVAWSTPAQAFRSARHVTSLAAAADGSELLIGQADGNLALMELHTGATIAELAVPNTETTDATSFYQLAATGPHRWIAYGLANPWELAYAIDSTGGKLVATRIPLFSRVRAEGRAGTPSVAILDGGDAIVTGDDLPLAIYDPATWQVKRVLDPQLGWGNVSVSGNLVVAAYHRFTWQRVDLTSGTVTSARPAELGVVTHPEAIAGGRVIYPGRRDDGEHLVILDGATATWFPDPAMHWLRDATGTRVLVETKTGFEIRALPGGELLHRIAGPMPHETAFTGDRMIAVFDTTIRTLDLATGALSADPARPPGDVSELAIDDTGAVIARAGSLWRLAGGAVVEEIRLDGPRELRSNIADDPTHYVLGTGDDAPSELHHFGSATADATWSELGSWWVGKTARASWGPLAPDSPSGQVTRFIGGKREPMFPTFPEVHAVDVDPDANIGVAATSERIGVWRDGKVASYEPRLAECHVSGVRLERGGQRIVAWSEFGKIVALFDRRDGHTVGDAQLGARLVDVAFVRGRPELVVTTAANELVVWTPNGAARTVVLPHLAHAAVSPDGRWLGLAFGDGRVAAVDYATFVASLPAGSPPPAAPPAPAKCESPYDPFSAIGPATPSGEY